MNALGASGTVSTEFDRWDFDIQKKSRKYCCELKCRSCFVSSHPDSLIEKSKYYALKARAEETNSTPLYFSHYLNGVVYVWNLNALPEPEWGIRPCNRNTCFGGDGDKVNKLVGGLPFEDEYKLKSKIMI